MGSLVLTGDTSGSVTLDVPLVAGSNTATIAAATGTHFPFTAGTLVNSTSGTSIDFTGIPSWVKRVTVMLNGVSTSGLSPLRIQIGSGSVETSGYTGATGTRGAEDFYSTGFILSRGAAASGTQSCIATLCTLGSNIWAISGTLSVNTGDAPSFFAGNKTTSGTLDRVRITTVNGTDTFDAGSINILYE